MKKIKAIESMKTLNKVFYIEYEDQGKTEYSLIKATQARNKDGTLADWKDKNPYQPRLVIQSVFIPKNIFKSKSYTNYWKLESIEDFLDLKLKMLREGK